MIESFALDRLLIDFEERVMGMYDFKGRAKHIHTRIKPGVQVVVYFQRKS